MKKIIAFALTMVLGFSLMGCGLFPAATTTTTEEVVVDTDNFIEINTVSDLQNIEMNKSYILMNDLDLTDIDWQPLGTFNEPYLAIFDGNGHTISNLTITTANDNYNGLFGFVSGEIKNLDITDFSISYTSNFLTYAGGLAGYIIGDVSNVTTSGTIDVTNTYSNTFAGLLVGSTQAVVDTVQDAADFTPNSIDGNSVSGDITVNSTKFSYVGGLVGKAFNTEFTNNYAEGTISVTGQDNHVYAGGLIGHYYGGILIGFEDKVDSTDILIQYNIAKVDITVTSATSGASVGGFVGYCQYGKVTDNVAIANIQVDGDTLYVGGFIGEYWHSILENIVVDDTLNVTTTDTTTYNIGTIVGKAFSSSDYTKNYFVVTSDNLDIVEQGTQAVVCDYSSASWLDNTFGWTADFYNKIITACE